MLVCIKKDFNLENMFLGKELLLISQYMYNHLNYVNKLWRGGGGGILLLLI